MSGFYNQTKEEKEEKNKQPNKQYCRFCLSIIFFFTRSREATLKQLVNYQIPSFAISQKEISALPQDEHTDTGTDWVSFNHYRFL